MDQGTLLSAIEVLENLPLEVARAYKRQLWKMCRKLVQAIGPPDEANAITPPTDLCGEDATTSSTNILHLECDSPSNCPVQLQQLSQGRTPGEGHRRLTDLTSATRANPLSPSHVSPDCVTSNSVHLETNPVYSNGNPIQGDGNCMDLTDNLGHICHSPDNTHSSFRITDTGIPSDSLSSTPLEDCTAENRSNDIATRAISFENDYPQQPLPPLPPPPLPPHQPPDPDLKFMRICISNVQRKFAIATKYLYRSIEVAILDEIIEEFEDYRVPECKYNETNGHQKRTVRRTIARRSLALKYDEWQHKKYGDPRLQDMYKSYIRFTPKSIKEFVDSSPAFVDATSTAKFVKEGIKIVYFERIWGYPCISAILSFSFRDFYRVPFNNLHFLKAELQKIDGLTELTRERERWFLACDELYHSKMNFSF
jgi:hypothetical protein